MPHRQVKVQIYNTTLFCLLPAPAFARSRALSPNELGHAV
jgi:hypothetical protein